MPPLRDIHHDGHQAEDQEHKPVEAQHGEETNHHPPSAPPSPRFCVRQQGAAGSLGKPAAAEAPP
eukprot:CAMPEP_0115473948 /NCGR_PEP_ID=MMETSP0271-20121206/53837_1 /TAXON_ID=71861 /ORGANISM="Scrippsiella trochoidea, Strain CCMP3099" /LENGTH=64 /DNA_ID=CAMNT_0002901251 /DNA_START=283 /DNA_END=473 /DNA_ORIENTATION=+